jgi:hypothetical protein
VLGVVRAVLALHAGARGVDVFLKVGAAGFSFGDAIINQLISSSESSELEYFSSSRVNE